MPFRKGGIPKEIKIHEYRVGVPPAGVRELVRNGHRVMVQQDAAEEIGMHNEDYERAGAEIVETPEEIFERAEMVVKVKEPQAHECAMLREGQVLFTFLHLAPDPKQTTALVESGRCVRSTPSQDDERVG